MFLKNYKKVISSMFYITNDVYDIEVIGTGGERYTDYTVGTNQQIASLLGFGQSDYYANSASSAFGVMFGDGDKEVSEDDYCLSGNVIGNLGFAKTQKVERFDDKTVKTIVYTLINNNTEAVTIKEMGYVGCVDTASGSTTTYKPIMLDRTLLEKPVTIEPSEVGQITYVVTLNY